MRKSPAEYGIPYNMHAGIERYIEHHIEPGGFLRAVFENDLESAVLRADEENLRRIGNFFEYLSDCAPTACWGSPDKVRAWLDERYMEEKGYENEPV